MHHVLLLLKGDVHNRMGDIFADAVEELGLTDNDTQVRVEVDFILAVLVAASVAEDRLPEEVNGLVALLIFPPVEALSFVVLCQFLG